MHGRKTPEYILRRFSSVTMSSSWPLLRLLAESGPLDQRTAAKRLGLSTGACNLHCQRLEHEGLILRAQRGVGAGRPMILWDLERKRNFCVTLVFDVPYFQATLHDLEGGVVREQREDISGVRTAGEVMERVGSFLGYAKGEVDRRGGRIRQGFAAMPGIVDHDTGEVRRAANFPVLNGLNVGRMVADRYGFPCYSGHLGLSFYYGETEALAGDELVMVLYLDLGIGVLFGRGDQIIRLAPKGRAPEPRHPGLGHVRSGRGGPLCHCGRRGCLEASASGWAMMRDLHFGDGDSLPDLLVRLGAREPRAMRVAARAMEFLGASLTWPIQMMTVDRIIVSGPLAPVLESVRPAFERGLKTVFTPAEVRALNPVFSSDPQASSRRGAFRVARRLFLYPQSFEFDTATVGGSASDQTSHRAKRAAAKRE